MSSRRTPPIVLIAVAVILLTVTQCLPAVVTPTALPDSTVIPRPGAPVQAVRVNELTLWQEPQPQISNVPPIVDMADPWAIRRWPLRSFADLRNVNTGESFRLSGMGSVMRMVITGNTLFTIERQSDESQGIYGYRLPNQERFVIAPPEGDNEFVRDDLVASGRLLAWVQSTAQGLSILGYDISSQQMSIVVRGIAPRSSLLLSGRRLAWLDGYDPAFEDGALYPAPLPPIVSDETLKGVSYKGTRTGRILVYDLDTRKVQALTGSETLGPLAITGDTVLTTIRKDDETLLLALDVKDGTRRVLAHLQTDAMPDLAADGNTVVWGQRGPRGDYDIYGCDLALGGPFIISQALGNQANPRISGNLVTWNDARRIVPSHWDAAGYNQFTGDVRGARLSPGPAPAPPIPGLPDLADLRIEKLYPNDGKRGTSGTSAFLFGGVFLPGSLKSPACRWIPAVQLWEAVNNEPARVIGSFDRWNISAGRDSAEQFQSGNVDIEPAREPNNRLYFFLTLMDSPSRTNVWAHAADARTYFPHQDVPIGAAEVDDAVDAKIEIVWPQGDRPVTEAARVNVTVMLFKPGTLLSVPPDFNAPVRLYRALNSGVAEYVGTGQKRITGQGGYPVWDFDDIDVSAARDPANKYYFGTSIDNIETHTNIWAHGASAGGTNFPRDDTLEAPCE